MLISFFFNFTTALSIFGYAFGFKKYILSNKENLQNVDFFFGLFFLYLLSLLINLLFNLSIFTLPVYLLGLFFFTFVFFKKKSDIKIHSLFLIIFIFTFVAFTNGNNVDSPMYHLQILKWLSTEKIIFGLSNLEIRFSMNSSWHSLISLLDINLFGFSSKYYLSVILLSILLNELINQKKSCSNSYYYLLFSTLLLLFYNLFHPYKNGVIFNHLGNPETDIASMVFFFFSIYAVILYEENKSNKIYIQLLYILIIFSITSRLTNIPLLLLAFYVLFINKTINYKLNFFLMSLVSVLWLIRNFILSGCFLFPIKQTCINTSWTVNIKNLINHKNEVLSWTRGHFSGNHDNYYYTLETYDWVLPWLKSYFLQDALLQIVSLTIILISFVFAFLKFLNFFSTKLSSLDLVVLLIFIFVLFFWFMAPEIRYGWGPIISFPAFLAYLVLKKFNFARLIFKNNNLTNSVMILFVLGIFLKSSNFFKKEDFLILNKKKFNYSKINKVKDLDGIEIFKSENWQCADFKKICVNTVKEDYNFDKQFGYKIISTN